MQHDDDKPKARYVPGPVPYVEEEKPLPPLLIALFFGFIQRPLLYVALGIVCFAANRWCAGQDEYHQTVAVGFHIPPEEILPEEELDYKLGIGPDPRDAVQTERGQRHLLISEHYRRAQGFLGYSAIGWVVLGVIGGLKMGLSKRRNVQ